NDFRLSSIVVAQPTLRITFITDTIVNASGWNLTYGLSPCGGVVHGPQNVITSPNYPSHYPNNVHCMWFLNYPEGEQIEFQFTNFKLEPSAHHDYVKLYNGPRLLSPTLGSYSGRKEPFSVGTSMTNNLLVEFHTDASNTDQGFRAVAARHVRGCGGVFHGMSGNFSSHGFPGSYEANTECEWEVDPTTGYHAVLHFTDRFDVESSTGCQNDYVQILYSKTTRQSHGPLEWQEGEKLCGKQIPPPVRSSIGNIKVLFHSNEAVQGDGFKVSWQLVCGNNFTDNAGYIVSPQHPQNYPNNANCLYRILASPGQFVTINFLNFHVEYGSNCRYDSVTVIQESSSGLVRRRWGPYCDRNTPPDVIISRGPTTLHFVSDVYVTLSGFTANFSVEACGGNLSSPGIIRLPTRPIYENHMSCTWDITAPQGKVIHLKFQILELEGHSRCTYDSVSIFDGHTSQEDKLVTRLCGNHTSALPTVVTHQRLARVIFQSDVSITGLGVVAALDFTYACGGNVNISYSGAYQTIRSLDADNDGNYEPLLDCGWLVEGLTDNVVTLNFTRLDVEPPGANDTSPCPYDGVMLYDGPSTASALISVHCNPTSLPLVVSSSSNVMFIRFYSDSTNQRPGFTAKLTNTPHPCGAASLEATNVTQVLESPGYPTAYPISTRCQWVITAPEQDLDIHLDISDFNLEASPLCSKDQLFISEYEQANSGATRINSGAARRYSINIGGRRAYFSMLANLAHGYCGTTFPHHLTSNTNAVRLSLVSDGDTVAPGFRLHYSIGGCNRTYNGSSGSVRTRGRHSSCYSTFVAPQGSFVNLYFNHFYINSRSRSCSSDNSLKIYDGIDSSATLLVTACGYGALDPVFSTGNALRLEHTPQGWASFDLTYSTSTIRGGCGGKIYTRRQGMVTSPGYPGPTAGGLDCIYTLAVTPSQHLSLRFSILDFRSSDGCNSTYLEMYDVSAAGEASLLNTLCGQEQVARHLSPSNKMALRYVTGTGNITGQGWKVSFQPAIPL
ncbi:hypothetical protein OTU49_004482, partial [Cherax quadricarinatus]